jgi:hypothetical protein
VDTTQLAAASPVSIFPGEMPVRTALPSVPALERLISVADISPAVLARPPSAMCLILPVLVALPWMTITSVGVATGVAEGGLAVFASSHHDERAVAITHGCDLLQDVVRVNCLQIRIGHLTVAPR